MIESRAIDEGHFIKIAEIVALSLYIFARGASYHDVENRLQHSPSTISTYHNQVLETLVKLSADIVRPYRSQDEVSLEITQKSGFYCPYFRDCVGALDGTHIQCRIADDICQCYRNRKGDT